MFQPFLVSTGLLLQAGVDVGPGVAPGGPTSLLGGAVSAFLTTLVVGLMLVAVKPEYTERMMADVFEEPLSAFAYGFGALVALILVSVMLAITIIALLLVVPLVIVAYLVWAVGATIGFLAISDRLVDHDESWLKPLLVAAGLNGALALTGVGGLVSLVVGAVGVGCVLRDYFA